MFLCSTLQDLWFGTSFYLSLLLNDTEYQDYMCLHYSACACEVSINFFVVVCVIG
jgi:hypothetical protein